MLKGAQRLLELWRDTFHPDASRERLAIAFAMIAGGSALALMGVALVGLGDLFLPRPHWLRELGFIAAAGGLPLFLYGFVVGMPTRTWVTALSVTGLTGVAVGVGLFSWLYPDQWYLTLRQPNVYAIGPYLFGVSALAASAAAELALTMAETVVPAGARVDDEDLTRPVTDEEIAQDLAWADRQGWSWGGIRDTGIEANVRLKDDVGPLRFQGRGKRVIKEAEATREPLIAAEALSALRGTKKPDTDTAVNDQVAFLKELKAQQAERQAAQQESIWWKLTHPGEWFRG
ncbi:MAG: hypothetical protein R3185_02280 [Candidatus Thermoplasmatota archaeon]|nr:hypothetical protein [Candidatus Thermoplasmatota archaeon]